MKAVVGEGISLRKVSKGFEGKNVLQNLSFSLSLGECIGLTGEAGSGKSVLLYLIAGVFSPNTGNLTIQGRSYREYTDEARRDMVGFVFSEPKFLPSLNNEERILSFIDAFEIRHIDRYQQRVRALASSFGVNLSKKRQTDQNLRILQLVLQLAREPTILIVDGFYYDFDVSHYHCLKRECENLQTQGSIVIFSSRHPNTLQGLADRFFEIKERTVQMVSKEASCV